MRNRKILKLLISIVALIVVVIIVAINRYNKMTKFNTDYVNGNTGGNLYNGGYFCEYDGMVYFRNPNDGNALYCMDRNGNNLEKLCSDSVSYINADAHYVYYTRNNAGGGDFPIFNVQTFSLCRLDKRNNDILVLDSDSCLYASLIGNYVYYSHYDDKTASTVYRVKIDGTERESVLRQPIIAVSANGEKLYYAGDEKDAHIYCINTKNGSTSTVLEVNSYMPIASGEYIYYINCDKGYYLERYNINTGEVTTLVKKRTECYNVYGSVIYYQTGGDDAALYRMKYNGFDFESEVIRTGQHCNINVTSTYVYFMRFGDDKNVYRTPTVGTVNVTVFSPDILNK